MKKRIIDFHTHIFPDSLAQRARQSLIDSTYEQGYNYSAYGEMTRSSLIDAMDRCGIDISVIQPVITKPSQTDTVNHWAADCACDRIVPFGGLHPDTDDYKRDIDMISSLGLKGIKLHAEYQKFYPDELRMLKVYDYAFSKGLIILHHAGFDPGYPPPFHTSPERFAKVLDEMKGGIMVLAHLGGHAQWDDVEKYLCGRDVYLDTSMGFGYFTDDQFLRIVKKHSAGKILFGTDYPWSEGKEQLAYLNSLPLTQAEKDMIAGENAQKLLFDL